LRKIIQSQIPVHGHLSVILTSGDGSQRTVDLGDNTPCQAFLNALAAWSVGINNTGQNPVSPPTQFILGTGTGTPKVGDTSLFTPQAGTQTVINARTSSTNTSTLTINYNKGQLNSIFTEAGLLDNSSNLMAHLVFQSSITIQDTEAATFIWTETFNAG